MIKVNTVPSKEWTALLGTTKAHTEENLAKAMNKAGRKVLRMIQDGTPVRTGRLKKSIKIKLAKAGDLKVEIFSDCPYVIFVEYGIGSQTDHPAGTRHPEWLGFAPRAMFRKGIAYMEPMLETELTDAVLKTFSGQEVKE